MFIILFLKNYLGFFLIFSNLATFLKYIFETLKKYYKFVFYLLQIGICG